MKRLALALVLLLVGLAAHGQTVYHANAVVVAWDAPTTLADGSPIPAGEAAAYEVLLARDGQTATPAVVGETTAVTAPVTLPQPGDWRIGVRAIRTLGGQRYLSAITWSAFVVRYVLPYSEPGPVRIVQ